jgi:flagellar biosynthesis protein FlhF
MMRYKVYEAETLQQAILKMIMDLGKDAILINHRTVRKGGILGLFGKKVVEVTAACPIKEEKTSSSATANEEKIYNNKEILVNIQREIQDIKSKVDNILLQGEDFKPRGYQGVLSEMYEKLLENEVEKDLSAELIARVMKESPPELLEDRAYVQRRLEAHIIKMLRISPPIELDNKGKANNPKVVMFIGPTGVGKTTTLAKLAADFSFNKKKKIAIITIDTYRVAAVEQLKAYCEILNVPLDVIFSPVNFEPVLNKYKNYELILVDTAGRSHKNIAQMAELKSYIDYAKVNLEIYLTLAANIKYKDMLDMVENFKKVSFHKLILTKVDESTKFGSILNLLTQIPQGVAYITNGQDVPENIEEADPYTLSRLILSSM